MALVRVLVNSNSQADVYFRDLHGAPLLPLPGSPAQFSIRDFNNRLIGSGTGVQDTGDPSHWFANVNIPANAAVSIDGLEKYSLIWQLATQQGPITTIERFEVFPAGDPVRRLNDQDVIVPSNMPFTDSIYVETIGVLPASSVSYSLVDESGNVQFSSGPLISTGAAGTADIYSVSVDGNLLSQASAAFITYMGIWTVVRPGATTEYQYHPTYVMSAGISVQMHKIQMLADRARIQDIHPYLSFRPKDFIEHLFRGIEFVASYRPNVTPISPLAIPGMLAYYITEASVVSLFRAQIIAEGMSAFNFSGLGVQLQVDRTGLLQNMVQSLENDIRDGLPSAKSNWIRNGQPTGPIGSALPGPSSGFNPAGVLQTSWGPFTNWETVPYGLFGGNYDDRNFFSGLPVFNFAGYW